MNIYVGNLSFGVSEENLRQAFEAFGQVNSATIIKDKYSGQPRGFGFVEMNTQAEAEKAIQMFNEYELDGRKLIVNLARPREERGPGGGGRGDRRGGGRDRGGRERQNRF